MKLANRMISGLVLSSLCTAFAWAGLTADEMKRLTTDLTPWGAERAGNKDGTIPAWTGGVDPKAFKVTVVGKVEGIDVKKYSDPFAEDKPLYTITASNMDKYADKLDEASKALLKRYPDTYKINIYPTHRSAIYPKFVIDNSLANAQTAKLESGGLGISGVYGGTPFPIPKDGYEVMWDFIVRNAGLLSSGVFETWYVDNSGNKLITTAGQSFSEAPYQDPSIGREAYLKMERPPLLGTDAAYRAPARQVGNENIYNEFLGKTYDRKVWSYVQGQRRVRVAPDLAYDTPIVSAGGVLTFDDSGLFWGALDRFDFKLVGKKEMFIPYNTYKDQFWAPWDTAAGAHHQNPETARWELHRVWVVEATVKPGVRHVYSKRVFLFDEDWAGGLQYSYDHAGKLYRTVQLTSYVMPEGVIGSRGFYAYDLISGVYGRNTQMSCKECGSISETQKGLGARYYSPEAVQARGVR